MGRIPLLLPLNVKPSEATGKDLEVTPRPQPYANVNSRRASYAYGASENGSFIGVVHAKQSRPSAASGSDVFGIALGCADRAVRPDASLLPGRESRPGGSTLALVPSSPLFSSDGSNTGRALHSIRHASNFGHAAANSNSSPLPTATNSPIRPAPNHHAANPTWIGASVAADPSSAMPRSPAVAAPVLPAASTSAGGGQNLNGMTLAQFALSSCSTAEQQLREMLVERTSPGPASPAPIAAMQSAPLPTAASVSAPPRSGPASPSAAAQHSPAPPSLPMFRRAPTAMGAAMGAIVAAMTSSPSSLPLHPSSPLPTVQSDPHRLAVSACSSPITSPVPQLTVISSPVVGCGGLLGALLDHRQMLAHQHPSAGKPERATRFAANADLGGAGNGSASAGQQQQEEGQREEDGIVSGCDDRESSPPEHATALVNQLWEGHVAGLQHHKQQQELEAFKSKRAGVIWASINPMSNRNTGDGSSQQPQQSSAWGSTAGPAVTAAAMRAVVELKNMDEFSLVAAARQRQQQVAKRTSIARHPTLKKLGSVGKHSLRSTDSVRALEDGLGFGGMPGSQLPHLLAAVRASCPEMGSNLESVQLTATVATALRPDGAAAAAEHGGASRGSSSGSAAASPRVALAATAHPVSDTADAGGNSMPFLPPVMSPRQCVGSTSTRSMTLSTSGGAAATSLVNSSAPTGLTVPQHLASEFAASGSISGALHTVAAGPAAAEQAEAAVRALAARFGSSALPNPRVPWDQEEHEVTVRERRKKLYEALQAANPAAYHEEAAEAAEAAYRALSERAQLKLQKLMQESTTEEAPARQLEEALRELTSQRPFFLPPVIPKPKLERTFKEADITRSRESSWNVDESIFAQRKKESESRELYDTEKVRLQQLNIDWKRVVSKARFRRMVSKGDLGVKEDGQSLEEELGEVREELQRQSDFIRAAFIYYSITSPGAGATSAEFLQMSASAWLAFCYDAGIVGKGCTSMDMQNIFVAVNFEEESETEEAAANDDDAMVRFEFMEGLIRAAFAKYIHTKRMTDASDALGMLLEEVVASPNLPPEARVDPNEWRRTRFYTPDVEEVLKEYWDLLISIFKLYKARDRARYLWPEHFIAFLESNQLLGLATGLTRREAKLIFAWSQSLVTDELRRRQRVVSLTLWDFIEALGRVADFMSTPDPEDMEQFFLEEDKQPPEPDRLVYEYYRLVGEASSLLRRPSAGLMSVPSRPLAPKLRQLLQYLVCTLREAWGGHDVREVAAKVMRTATFLSGGIEMG
ncbi:hypothetical protein Vretimale_12241 [Volvox reticuliferus]|uniref:Uncharacterized protein n=1 Tax=Volvox reticuliferus TaxID=1737510 RepID=A0A8J4LSE0_9CHLO|nr:hypothetical protein Vretifemale_8961 [Volvox reticuliferus]GIM08265.1 hypothetical protein Vretimale_12241 [Volvox reticuliferus]